MGDASVVFPDLNHDGNLDAATGDLEHGTAAVMLGNGTGALQLLATYPTGQYTVQIVSADFNGDGNPDLATANQGHVPRQPERPALYQQRLGAPRRRNRKLRGGVELRSTQRSVCRRARGPER